MSKLFFVLFFSSFITFAQDSLKFKISDIKRLPTEELDSKKEGTFVTGVPDLSVDPINGFGYGVEGSITFDGKKSNPFFAYTPYMAKLDVAIFNTSKNQREFKVTLDKPYIFKSKWRLRGEAAYEINPNLLYFGLTQGSLNKLNVISNSDKVPSPSYTGTKYNGYENSLTGQYTNFNIYTKEEYILNISGEYNLLDGKMRLILGGEIAGMNISTTSNDLSRLRNDKESQGLLGLGKSTVVFFQSGLVYDVRDFEPDPNKGVFAEITNEYSSKAFGSAFNLDKLFGQVRVYKELFPKQGGKIIFASRLGAGYTFGNAPFFEYQDEWSSEGSIEGLGGTNTLRGYKQSRFLDRGMYFYNAEIRARFYQFSIWKQDIALSAVPFFDAGSVFSRLNDVFKKGTLRYNEGLGLRVAWNLSTILRFDYAISKEDKQFFFTFGHAF